jgi:hypothetical protein
VLSPNSYPHKQNSVYSLKIKIEVILAVHLYTIAEREGQLPHLLGQAHGLSGQMAGI